MAGSHTPVGLRRATRRQLVPEQANCFYAAPMGALLCLLLAASPPFPLDEATAAQLQQWLTDGKFTSRQLVELYDKRIDELDKNGPALHAVIELNPDALAIADALDAERKTKGSRGPLHGIPILIKDNIETG